MTFIVKYSERYTIIRNSNFKASGLSRHLLQKAASYEFTGILHTGILNAFTKYCVGI